MEDPTGDGVHEKLKGLIHRYPDRVLLKPTLTCLAYCRFCFRRETVGPGGAQTLWWLLLPALALTLLAGVLLLWRPMAQLELRAQ